MDTNTTQAAPHTDAEWADMQTQIEAARTVPCEVEGCDGTCPVSFDYPADWIHEVDRGELGDLQWTADVLRGRTTATIYFPDAAHELDAATLRALADEYENLPAKLRALADELDRRNA